MSPSVGVHVPLLAGSKSAKQPASVSGAVFNVATSIIGSGIMSIPAILKVLGVIPAFAMILIVAVLAEISVDFLMRFTHAGETTTYSGVMREAFGSPGALTVQVFVTINNFGGLILYLIIIAGVHVPLLAGSTSAEQPASVSGAVFNVATSIIGAGIMSIPAILKVLGVIPAFAMILIVAVLAEISVDFLMRFTHSGETTTYSGVMREAFGSLGALSAQVCVIVTNFGGLILFLIIIGDVLSGKHDGGEVHLGILQQWFGVQWWNSREVALFFTLLLVMLPLVLYRRVESLKYSSAVSTLLAVAFVAICCGLAVVALVQGKTQTPRMYPKLDHQTSFFDLFTAVPVVVTAFTFHFNVHPIGFELAKASDMKTAVRLALVFCAFIYFTIGVFGYLLFGDSTQSDILINFDQNADSAIGTLFNTLIRVSYALHVMLVFPIINFSLRANIDELLFPKKPLLATDNKRFVILTLLLLVFCYLAAIAIPDIWYFFQFLGSSSALCLAFIFPGIIVLRDALGISTRKDKIIALVMIILAVVTSVIAIATNIYNAFSSKS